VVHNALLGVNFPLRQQLGGKRTFDPPPSRARIRKRGRVVDGSDTPSAEDSATIRRIASYSYPHSLAVQGIRSTFNQRHH
jgi:hypothetical protein